MKTSLKHAQRRRHRWSLQEDKDLAYQRVFLARSDPTRNSGMVGAIPLNKVVLFRLHLLAEETGVLIYPIIGVGSVLFRGNLIPETVE